MNSCAYGRAEEAQNKPGSNKNRQQDSNVSKVLSTALGTTSERVRVQAGIMVEVEPKTPDTSV